MALYAVFRMFVAGQLRACGVSGLNRNLHSLVLARQRSMLHAAAIAGRTFRFQLD